MLGILLYLSSYSASCSQGSQQRPFHDWVLAWEELGTLSIAEYNVTKLLSLLMLEMRISGG